MTTNRTPPPQAAPGLTVPGVSIGHGCSDCFRLTVTPRYLNGAGASYVPVVTFTASHGTPREGADGGPVDAYGDEVTPLDVPLDALPALIARLQEYAAAQEAAGDVMVDGWPVEG